MELVEFEYDTWKKFHVATYYRSGEKLWPIEIIRKLKDRSKEFKLLGIVKTDEEELIRIINPSTGSCEGYGTVVMDLDDPWVNQIERENFTLKSLLSGLGYLFVSLLNLLPEAINISESGEFYLFPSVSFNSRTVFFRWMLWTLKFRNPSNS